MRKAKTYLLNGIAVAGVGIVLRFAAMAYNVYISKKLGPEGMGLLTLVLSVYGLAVTFASAGVNLCCVRLVADALALKNPKEARRSIRGCALYGLLFGLSSSCVLYFAAPEIGRGILENERTVSCLRALCPAIPLSSLSACLGGYFTASRRAFRTSVPGLAEQFFKILLTAFFFTLCPAGKEIEAVTYGSCLSEILAFLILLFTFLADTKKHLPHSGNAEKGLTKRLLGISLPIAFTAWIRSALVTAEHILIPKGLSRYGKENALSSYGIMHGMALPVVLFPYAVLSPFTSLLMPEISRFKAENKKEDIAFVSALTLRLTLLFSFACASLFFFFGRELGILLYGREEVGKTISLFAPIVPVMYIDTAADAVLKGLGEQVYCMKVNIADAALSLLLVLLLVPRAGAVGYIVTVFLSECFNTFFSVLRLFKRTDVSLSFAFSVILPCFCAFLSAFAAKKVTHFLPLSGWGIPAFALFLFLIFYLPLLTLSGGLSKTDRRYFKRLVKGK